MVLTTKHVRILLATENLVYDLSIYGDPYLEG